MLQPILLTLLASGFASAAKRAANATLCEHYSTLLLGASNATTQHTLMTLVVNTAVIGNYSSASKSYVPGILAADATFNNAKVNLLQFFDGSLYSTNNGDATPGSTNFLDGGGAAPLKMNMPANNVTSNQYGLLTHLYEFFGDLLGCSAVSTKGFPSYGGVTSMYEVHKFMALDANEVGYFIEQVGLSAASFGVAAADVQYVGKTLQSLFGMRCAPAVDILPGAPAQLQAICTDPDCPEASPSNCSAYEAFVEPKTVSATSGAGASSTGMGMPMGTSGASATATASGANSTVTWTSPCPSSGTALASSGAANPAATGSTSGSGSGSGSGNGSGSGSGRTGGTGMTGAGSSVGIPMCLMLAAVAQLVLIIG